MADIEFTPITKSMENIAIQNGIFPVVLLE